MVAVAVKIIIILIMCQLPSAFRKNADYLLVLYNLAQTSLSDFCQLSNDLNFVLVLLRFN